MYENEFLLVEKLLESYPIEWRRNYYNNKKSLKIDKIDESGYIFNTAEGTYNEEKNLITLYYDESLIHELFHLCFRDGEKLNKQIDSFDYHYSNGIIMKNKTTNMIYGVALTEGFVEYLSRKISNSKGYVFEYFIVDLLISIYGEDILKYPFTNDISGFYHDKRFYKILDLSFNLDIYYFYNKTIMRCMEYLKKIMEENNKEKKLVKEIIDKINEMIKELYISMTKCINIIIKEYKNCKYPMIENKDFILKIKQFLVDPDCQVIISLFEVNKYDLNKKVQKILKKL